MLWLIVFAIHNLASAQEATVWVRNPAAVRNYFPPEHYKMLNADAEAQEMEDSGYLEPHAREALFHKLKLEDRLARLDDLDKDMLVMGAKFETLPSLVKHYPMLTRDQLVQLKKEMKGK